jgi:DNA-binding NtrC family response regulator
MGLAEQKRRLLAIDDNIDSAELVGRVAGRCGYEARTACTTGEVRQHLSDWRPDVVTLDLCMPDSDGIDLLHLLQGSGFNGRIVIVSGQDPWLLRSARRLAAARGFDVAEEVRKPLDLPRFRQLLERLHVAG